MLPTRNSNSLTLASLPRKSRLACDSPRPVAFLHHGAGTNGGSLTVKTNNQSRWGMLLGMLATGTALSTGFAAPSFAQEFQTTTPIRHVVVIFQENASFDHYFGTYPTALNPAGQPPVKPFAH